MRRRGFTLLEATVALAIVGVVAVGALEAFAVEARAAAQARSATPAVAIAGERLAQLELLDAAVLRSLPDSLRRGFVSGVEQSYEWTASAVRVTDEPDLLEVHIEVRWVAGSYAVAERLYRPMVERVR